jgi:hypothetical protein
LAWVAGIFKRDIDRGLSPGDRILNEKWLLPMST